MFGNTGFGASKVRKRIKTVVNIFFKYIFSLFQFDSLLELDLEHLVLPIRQILPWD